MSRLERIAQKRSEPSLSKDSRDIVMQSCRSGKEHMDPALRCAMDSPSDDEAQKCIERFVNDVVKPGNGGSGVGINPLLEP